MTRCFFFSPWSSARASTSNFRFRKHLGESRRDRTRCRSTAGDRRTRAPMGNDFPQKRPETVGALAQVQSQALAGGGFTLPSVYVVQGSRGRIAASPGLDVVVD